MANSKRIILNSKGQSVVEYLLLLLVVTSLVFTVIRGQRFKDFMGKDSSFLKVIRKQIEFSYRHGLLQAGDDESDYTGDHHTYRNSDTGDSRFFGGPDPYGF